MGGKKKTAASAENFKFAANDPVVIANLSTAEIADVDNWQTSTQYLMEFHEGHETGYPIYIRPVKGLKKTESNIPKANTKNVASGTYSSLAQLENGEKLTANLKTDAQSDLLAILTNEWDTLVILARRYWTNEEPPVAQQARPDMKCTKCDARYTGDCNLGAANQFGKYTCKRCGKATVVPV